MWGMSLSDQFNNTAKELFFKQFFAVSRSALFYVVITVFILHLDTVTGSVHTGLVCPNSSFANLSSVIRQHNGISFNDMMELLQAVKM